MTYETNNQNALYALKNNIGETLANVVNEHATDARLVEYVEKICRFDSRFNIVLRLACRFAARSASIFFDGPEREEIEKAAVEYRERVREYLEKIYGFTYRNQYAVTDAVIEWAAFAD